MARQSDPRPDRLYVIADSRIGGVGESPTRLRLRDFGLLLSALTLARLASIYDLRWFGERSGR
jgi:hypothetical protein